MEADAVAPVAPVLVPAPSRKKPREKTIEAYFLEQCRKHRMLCFKYTSPARNGVPDRVVISTRGTVFVELKRPGETPTALQREVHHKIRSFGGEVHVIDTKRGVDAFVAAHRPHPVAPESLLSHPLQNTPGGNP